MEGLSVTVDVSVTATSPPGSNTCHETVVKMNGTSGSGSSSHKDKHQDKSHSSSSKHKHKEKERDKEHSSSHKSSHKSSSSDKDKSSSKHSSSKDGSSSSHKSSSHKSSHKDSHKDKSKDKEKSHSSSGDKDKSHSSSGEKKSEHKSEHKSDKKSEHKSEHKSHSKDKHKDKHRDKDGKHSSSSSSKHSSSDKHKSSSSSSDKKKEEKKEKGEKEVKTEVKTELKTEVKKETEDEGFISPTAPTSESQEDIKVKKEAKREPSDYEDASPQKRVKKERKSYVEDEEEEEEPEEQHSDGEDWQEVKKKKKSKKEKEPPKPAKEEKKRKAEAAATPPSKKAKTAAPPTPTASPTKGRKKKEEEPAAPVWKWWEEEKPTDGSKWRFLEHKGVMFPPDYEPLPDHVVFKYDGEKIKLSPPAEEIAGFYARMLEHDYTTKDAFNKNFFRDWRKNMTNKEQKLITDLGKCDFRPMHAYFIEQSEIRKNKSKEEKKAIKEENQRIIDEYGWAVVDGHKQKIGNFRIEPPGLFRGRGDHPKMGTLKKRVQPEDVSINCSKDSTWPKPPPGHKWKEVRHDNTVTWLATWTENVQNQNKYVMLGATSRLKGEKDWLKYETARSLHTRIDKIRADYQNDWSSKEMRVRQRGVALYFIDKLALRAGNEKDSDEAADTVGCCSLRVEHINLHKEKDGREYVVEFDFLGKDSIRYHNEVPIEKQAFKNLKLFKENKKDGDDLFDRLNTGTVNEYLRELMDGLTAKVFRTYNASRTLEEELQKLTEPDDPLPAKILSYNRANRAVAVLCNHQRAVSKNHGAQMERAQAKVEDKRNLVEDAERDAKNAKKELKATKTQSAMNVYEKKKKTVERLKDQLAKLEMGLLDKEEGKTISLGTSKLNYLDPRISVAWSKKWEVPVEKVYNKTQKEKFQWAIDMAEADYEFLKFDESKSPLKKKLAAARAEEARGGNKGGGGKKKKKADSDDEDEEDEDEEEEEEDEEEEE